MSTVRRALFMSTGDRYIALVAGMAGFFIVSRILSPSEIGVSVVGTAIAGMALPLREFASMNYLFQRKEMTQADVRGVTTVLLLVTSIISAALVALAPLFADIYGEPGLISYLRVVAVGVLLEVVSTPILALLRREMLFGKVAIINASGATAAAGAAIILAMLGVGYMSIAWAWLAGAFVTGAIAVTVSRGLWMFKPSLGQWRQVVSFGLYNGMTILLYRAYDALPYLLLGRLVSLNASAIYSRAQMIGQIPDKVFLGGAVAVALPAFSAEARRGGDLKKPYLGALSLITVFQWPALIVLAILAHPIVDLLLGHQWIGTAPLVQIIAAASLFAFSFELNYPVMVSVGEPRDIVLRALTIFPASAAILSIAAFFGLTAVACSLLVAIPFQAVVSVWFVRRYVPVTWRDLAAAVSKSGLVAAVTAAAPLAVVAANGGFDLSILQGVLGASLSAIGWVAGILLTRHTIYGEISRLATDMRGKVPRPAAPHPRSEFNA